MTPEEQKLMWEEQRTCDFCSEIINTKYKSYVSLKYGSRSLLKANICKCCAEKQLGIPWERFEYIRCYTEFMISEQLSAWDTWTQYQTAKFIKLLNKNKIPILNYDHTLFIGNVKGKEYSFKIHKIYDPKIERFKFNWKKKDRHTKNITIYYDNEVKP
jgi:hypothetical protein